MWGEHPRPSIPIIAKEWSRRRSQAHPHGARRLDSLQHRGGGGESGGAILEHPLHHNAIDGARDTCVPDGGDGRRRVDVCGKHLHRSFPGVRHGARERKIQNGGHLVEVTALVDGEPLGLLGGQKMDAAEDAIIGLGVLPRRIHPRTISRHIVSRQRCRHPEHVGATRGATGNIGETKIDQVGAG